MYSWRRLVSFVNLLSCITMLLSCLTHKTVGAEICQEHWITQSGLAANPEIINTRVSASPILTSVSVFKETLLCFGKVNRLPIMFAGLEYRLFCYSFCWNIFLSCTSFYKSQSLMTLLFDISPLLQMVNLQNLLNDYNFLSDLLKAFQPSEIPDYFFQGMQLIPSPGSTDYLYSGAFIFLGNVFDVGMCFSFCPFSSLLKQNKEKQNEVLSLNYSFCSNKLFVYTGFRSLAYFRVHGYIHTHIP